MRKLFNIDQDEKNRILEMHENATKRHYLNEQGDMVGQQQSSGLTPQESKAVKMIEDRISRGEQQPVIILPENPTIAYQYPSRVENGETPYWANGLFVYAALPGRAANLNKPGSKTISPYAGHFKTVSLGTDKKWTTETYTIIPPQPSDSMNLQSIVGPENFNKMILASFSKLDENSKNVIKQYVTNSKEFPQAYKQIIVNA